MRKFILCLSLLFFVGCIEYNEEMWINKDLSGKLKMTLKIAEMVTPEGQGDLYQNLNEKIRSIKGLKLVESKTFKEGKNNCSSMVIEFDNVETLNQLQVEEKNGGPIGDISVKKLDNGNIKFVRTLTTGKEDDLQAAAMVNAMFGQLNWNYIIHFPCKVVTANVAGDKIDKKNNTVTWTFSLGSLMTKPQTMQATLNPKLFSWALIVSIVIGIILVIAIIFMWKRKKRSMETTQTEAITTKSTSPYREKSETNLSPSEQWRQKGISMLVKGDYAGAVESFSQAIAIDAKCGRAYHNRGFARFNLGDNHKAIEDFDKAIELDPDYATSARTAEYRNLAKQKI